MKKISNHISKKVTDKLAELFKADREDFETKWDDIKIFIQYGMLSDEKFNERASKFWLFKNTEGKYFTMEEYKEHITAAQTDKDNKLVYLYTNDPCWTAFLHQQRCGQKLRCVGDGFTA